MRKKLGLSLFALLVAVAPALAQFEGVLEMKLTFSNKDAGAGGGTMTVAVSKAGSRSEMNIQMQQMTMKMVMLAKSDKPDTIYRINDTARTYTEINLANLRAKAPQQPDTEAYTVKKLGEEKILGYNTHHVLVTRKNSNTELWTAKDVLDYSTFSRLQARPGGRPGGDEALIKALKEAEADGMPLKSVATSDDGSKTTMEVVKADKQSLPASTFEIPAGYTKSAGGAMDVMSGMSGPQVDAAKKQMEDAMKNMTPEQRQMMENMMKQRRGANQ